MTSVVNIASGASVALAKETHRSDLWAFHRQKLRLSPGAGTELPRADERDCMHALFDITDALQSGLPAGELFSAISERLRPVINHVCGFTQSIGQSHRKAPYRRCGFTSRARTKNRRGRHKLQSGRSSER